MLQERRLFLCFPNGGKHRQRRCPLSANLFSREKVYTFLPNQEKHFILGSAASAYFKGKYRWETDAYTKSNFRLSGYVEQPGGTTCCGYKQSRWITYAVDGAPASSYMMQDEISSWHFGKGPFYNLISQFGGVPIDADLGCFLGAPHPSCSNPIIVAARQAPGKGSMNAQEQIFTATIEEGAFFLMGATPDVPARYTVFDAAGRRIAEGITTEGRQRLMSTEGLVPGVYLIRVSAGSASEQVLKLVL